MSNIAVALAHELGNHIDDLVYSKYRTDRAIELPDGGGSPVGYVQDTHPGDNDMEFYVSLEDGRMVKVTCEEVKR
jgi:hypothetical protein